MRFFRPVFLLISFLSGFYSSSQGHEITFKIPDFADSTIYLGNYYSGATYVNDTALVDKSGTFIFSDEEPLVKGVYFLVQDGVRLFDFLVGNDQVFTIETKGEDYVTNMKVDGDDDNQLFLQDMLFNVERNREAEPYIAVLQDSLASESEKRVAQTAFEKIGLKVKGRMDLVIDQYPESLIAAIHKSNRRTQIPQAPEGEEDPRGWQYNFYKSHFWDDFDLGNPFLLRLQKATYRAKVDEYFDKVIFPNPDSVVSKINQLVPIAKKDSETYKFFVWHLTLKYQNAKLMGFDKVFVHLIDTYFKSGEMDFWANASLKKNMFERADQLRNSLVGLKAPNLILQNDKEERTELHEQKNKYTVLYFYDPDCGHCKKETPVLKEFYENSKHDVGVFTVSADTSMSKMTDYISEVGIEEWVNTNGTRTYGVNYQKVYDAFSTPTLYLLNEEKEIIAKKLPSSRLEEFIDRYESLQKDLN